MYLNPTKSFYVSQALDINMRVSLNNTSLRRLWALWDNWLQSFLRNGSNISRIIIRRVSCCPTLPYCTRKYRYLTNTPQGGCTLFATIRYKIFIAFQRGIQRIKALTKDLNRCNGFSQFCNFFLSSVLQQQIIPLNDNNIKM